jgi:hypothetical protein
MESMSLLPATSADGEPAEELISGEGEAPMDPFYKKVYWSTLFQMQ